MGAAESPDRKRRRHDSRERDRSRERAERREYSRDRSRERGSLRGRDTEGSTRLKHSDNDRTDRRDGPATTSGRNHQEDGARHEREQDGLNGRGAGSRQQGSHQPQSTRDRDRQQDSRRDRSRERQREQDRDRQRERERDRERDPERDRDRTHRGREGRGDKDRERDRGDREREREDRDRATDKGITDRGDRDRDRGGYDRGGNRATDHKADHPSERPSSRRDRDDRGLDHNRGSHREQQQGRAADPPHQREHSHRDSRPPERSGRPQEQQQQLDKNGKPKWGKPEEWAADEAPPPSAPKEGPNLGLSGKLAAETNKTADGTAELKFTAPAEARVCKKPVWKLFVYKGQDTVGDPIPLTQMPFYMFGKDRKVADIPTDHPSCSRQHAVLVFREVEVDAADGIGYARAVKPYLLDLETTNGTSINKEKLEPARYYELLNADVIRFGFSSRDYVIMNESAVQ